LLPRQASHQISTRVPHRPPFVGFVAQPTNRSLLGFEAQTKKPSRWFWGSNHQTRATSFEAQTRKPSTTLVLRLNQETHCQFWGQTERKCRHQFWGQTGENSRHWFWGQTSKNRRNRFWGQTARNRSSGFEAKPLTNHRHWFWGWTKKPALLVSTCQVQTAHGATRPLDRPATEYPTYATIPGPLHQVFYSCHDPHRCTPCRTYHLHTTRQANVILQMKRDKKKTKKNCPGFEFEPLQVNDSSQSSQGTDHLVSHIANVTIMKVALLHLDTATKPSLIIESVVETRINIHPTRENLTTWHTHGLLDPTYGNSSHQKLRSQSEITSP
jgi:hypothetical protein